MKISHLVSIAATALLANLASAHSVAASLSFSSSEQPLAWSGPGEKSGGPSSLNGVSWSYKNQDDRPGGRDEHEDELEIAKTAWSYGNGHHHVDQRIDLDSGCWNDGGISSGGSSESGSSTGISPIPEPSTYAAVLGLAALGLAASRRRVARADREVRG